MKFFISNKTETGKKFGNWHYFADKKCKVITHNNTLYIYFGYLIQDDLDSKIINDFDKLIHANGSFTVARISAQRVDVVVDYFAKYKVFAHQKNDLIEITNNFGLLSLTSQDIDIEEAGKRLAIPKEYINGPHLTGEAVSTWTEYHKENIKQDEIKEYDPACSRTIFKNVYMLEPCMQLCATNRVFKIRLADYFNDISVALKEKSKFNNIKELEDYMHESMTIHSNIIKDQYKDIHCTVSEGIDSVLQTMYFNDYKKSMYRFIPETVPWKYKEKILKHFKNTHVEDFYLDKISNYCEKYSRDPSCYDFDILPTYCTIKNLDPVPDMIMYGAGGDEMMLHKSRAMQSQVFQMLWDENKNDILKRYNDYLNSHQHTYSAKRNILGTVGFQTLEEQYSSLEWEKYPDSCLKFLSNFHTFPNDFRDISLPKKATMGLYCRQISSECDTEVTSLYCDFKIFFEVMKLPLKTRVESTIDVGLQKNILKRYWNFNFETPHKDGATFNTFKAITPYYKSSIAYVLKDNLRELLKNA